ncbi:hypothetical protein GGS20DRAFT_556399 [Poronia punctata]|nr:hypothetical protein GGS20DRAFT_556399 [Poronia punctata]
MIGITGYFSRIASPRLLRPLQRLIDSLFLGYICSWLKAVGNVIFLRKRKDSDGNILHEDRLSSLWGHPKKTDVVFVALCVGTSSGSADEITEVALATWCLDDDLDFRPSRMHWCIQDTYGDDGNSAGMESLALLTGSSLIPRSYLEFVLEEEFRCLTQEYQNICLVGHDISTTLHVLSRYWKAPNSAIMVDTRNILRSLSSQPNHTTIHEGSQTVLRNANRYHNTGHVEDDAQDTIAFVQTLGRDILKNPHLYEQPIYQH